MLTRANIAYNLHISPHQHEVVYMDGQKVNYFFSSEMYKNKFIERLQGNRETINVSLSKRFNVTFQCDIVADLRLYSTIEKRGFLVMVDGDEYVCQRNIILNGTKVMPRS